MPNYESDANEDGDNLTQNQAPNWRQRFNARNLIIVLVAILIIVVLIIVLLLVVPMIIINNENNESAKSTCEPMQIAPDFHDKGQAKNKVSHDKNSLIRVRGYVEINVNYDSHDNNKTNQTRSYYQNLENPKSIYTIQSPTIDDKHYSLIHINFDCAQLVLRNRRTESISNQPDNVIIEAQLNIVGPQHQRQLQCKLASSQAPLPLNIFTLSVDDYHHYSCDRNVIYECFLSSSSSSSNSTADPTTIRLHVTQFELEINRMPSNRSTEFQTLASLC